MKYKLNIKAIKLTWANWSWIDEVVPKEYFDNEWVVGIGIGLNSIGLQLNHENIINTIEENCWIYNVNGKIFYSSKDPVQLFL